MLTCEEHHSSCEPIVLACFVSTAVLYQAEENSDQEEEHAANPTGPHSVKPVYGRRRRYTKWRASKEFNDGFDFYNCGKM